MERRAKGGRAVKYSKQRNIVLDIVKNSYEHPTAEMVYAQAKEILPSIGIATVYRNLNALSEAGEIIRVPDAFGHDRYDGEEREHYHIKCRCCGKLVDVFPEDKVAFDEALANMRSSLGIKNMDVSLEDTVFNWVCDDCMKKKEQ